MDERKLAPIIRIIVFISFAAALFAALPVSAQSGVLNLRAASVGSHSITVAWDATQGFFTHEVFYRAADADSYNSAGVTEATTLKIHGLNPDTEYRIMVGYTLAGFNVITARTAEQQNQGNSEEPELERSLIPPPSSCNHLPPTVAVTGFGRSTQCQMVGEVAIAKTGLLGRGFKDAVDVWSYVPEGVEVCFREDGWMAFLDADYIPRMVMELESHQRDGMTCGTIDRAGTVVLLASAPAATQPGAALRQIRCPSSRPSRCTIVKSSWWRRSSCAPNQGGEIIGLVWMNSEVPVFEINGYWYKIEFEGQTGYVSRYFRRVLRGGCG